MTNSEWRAANARWLQLALKRLQAQLNRRALWLENRATSGVRLVDWLVAGDDGAAERTFYTGDTHARFLEERTLELSRQMDECQVAMRGSSRAPALELLGEAAGLAPFELQLLLLVAAPALDGAFARAYGELHDDPRRTYATLHLALSTFVEQPGDRIVVRDCLMASRPLRALRLVSVEGATDDPLLTRRLSVDERVTDFLRGANRSDSQLAPFLTAVRGDLATPAMQELGDRLAERIAASPGEWITINLIGPLDGGGRGVVERACDASGLKCRALDVARLVSCTAVEREEVIALLGREAVLTGLALLVDTTRVERASAAASVVDELTARLAAPLFLVGTERWPGEHRAICVQIPRPTREEQRLLWKSALSTRVHSVNGELGSLVQQFDFGPGAIAAAVERASSWEPEITPRALWRACRDQGSADLDDLAQRLEPCYGWDDIVVSGDVRLQLRELADQIEQRGPVYEGWGFGAQLGRGRGITALFAGPSGTGKTMAAEILAAHLELDLYRVDLAGVVSKYIGETEKNLRRVFDAAERSGAILLFDEADALFGSRTEVRDSHDRYANVEVNYLLQRMESYTGLAILATNRRAALDGAFLRRLRFVVEFPFPSPDDRRRIWQRVFPARAELDGVEFPMLSRLELSGGNIRSIAVNAAFLAARQSTPIRMQHVVRAAAREYAKLSKAVSAAEFGPYYAMVRP